MVRVSGCGWGCWNELQSPQPLPPSSPSPWFLRSCGYNYNLIGTLFDFNVESIEILMNKSTSAKRQREIINRRAIIRTLKSLRSLKYTRFSAVCVWIRRWSIQLGPTNTEAWQKEATDSKQQILYHSRIRKSIDVVILYEWPLPSRIFPWILHDLSYMPTWLSLRYSRRWRTLLLGLVVGVLLAGIALAIVSTLYAQDKSRQSNGELIDIFTHFQDRLRTGRSTSFWSIEYSIHSFLIVASGRMIPDKLTELGYYHDTRTHHPRPMTLLDGLVIVGQTSTTATTTTTTTTISVLAVTVPKWIAFYYGWPSLVQSASGNLSAATSTFSQFDLIVFGDGIASVSHGDHANTQTIIGSLNTMGKLVYGYIDLGVTTQNLSVAQMKTTGWPWVLKESCGMMQGELREKKTTKKGTRHSPFRMRSLRAEFKRFVIYAFAFVLYQ